MTAQIERSGPKKFYQSVTTDKQGDRYHILLDGRPAKTPARNILTGQTKAFAKVLADEWRAQKEIIDLKSMIVTRIAMSALDLTDQDRVKTEELVTSYLQTDLLCYFADGPQDLRERQEKSWCPYLEWAATENIHLQAGTGIIHIDQHPTSIERVRSWLKRASDVELIVVARLTEMTGSALLAIWFWKNGGGAEKIFEVAQIDETFQAEKWGADQEAIQRRDALRTEFVATAVVFSLLDAN